MGARVVIVGSGGREHALGLALAACPSVATLLWCGGANAGLSDIAEPIAEDAIARTRPDLVVIGPEAPLVDGLADRLRDEGIAVFGPSAAAARLEASKAFTKEVCARASIPTADAVVARTEAEALAALQRMERAPVVKADGLAAGKGVVVARSLAEAADAVRAAFAGRFGAAGQTVLLEERLRGPEVSVFALSDGATVRFLATARDYKRAFDGDAGPNTGGMGAVSPAPDVDEAVVEGAMRDICTPAVAALAARGTPYVGVLYAGLILTPDGPKLIEFNVRFGDPECQVVLPRLDGDLFALLHATATGRLAAHPPSTLRPIVEVGVVVAAAAYPQGSADGEPVVGLDRVAARGATVIHAGTRRDGATVLANGGRVLTIVAGGPTTEAARRTVYGALEELRWPGGRYRRDIGCGPQHT